MIIFDRPSITEYTNLISEKNLQFALAEKWKKDRDRLLAESKDDIFIKHIQKHLKEGQEVICKICGKTAKEIQKQEEK